MRVPFRSGKICGVHRPLTVLLSGLVACAAPTVSEPVDWPEPPILSQDAALPEAQRRHVVAAREALARLRVDARDEDAAIWYGRRLAYLGALDDAIGVYTRALALHPSSPRLLRHRGHRYISQRRFALAERDLELAARQLPDVPNAIEPDGMPNARGIPTSSLHGNVWYHLALARYCLGNLDDALYAWQRCLDVAANRDSECAARYWLYLTAMRLGDTVLAASILDPVRADWDVVENHAYHRLLLLFRGEMSEAEVAGGASADAVQDATIGYGLARHRLLKGAHADGRLALERVAALASNSFGCIAAECDLRRDPR